jgi:hypothetical protein
MSQIINFSNRYYLNKIIIEDLQNISLFIIGVSSLLSSIYCYNSTYDTITEKTPFDILLPVVGIHATIDLFISDKYDVKIHHIFILGILFYNNYYDVSDSHRFMFSYPLLKTEISSIFYVLKYWLPTKSIIYNINAILFYISFFKLRIFDFYYEIIYNNSKFQILFENYSQTNYVLSSILLISCYGLYLLNLYWFLIINKIIYKGIVKNININTETICHFLASYMYWINNPVALYIYSYNPNEKNIMDMIGITSLSISSYIYHYDIYYRLSNKQIQEYTNPDKYNIVIFLNDTLFINLRSFLIIVTNYYYNPYFSVIIATSGLAHLYSIYHNVLNILELFIDNTKTNFLNNHNIITGLPIAYDVSLLIMNSPIEIAIPFLLVNIIMALLFVIEPFYKLNHVAFHVLLIAQTYYMCLSSSQ